MEEEEFYKLETQPQDNGISDRVQLEYRKKQQRSLCIAHNHLDCNAKHLLEVACQQKLREGLNKLCSGLSKAMAQAEAHLHVYCLPHKHRSDCHVQQAIHDHTPQMRWEVIEIRLILSKDDTWAIDSV